MRIASFRSQAGESYGLVANGGIVDAGQRLRSRFPSILSILQAGALDELKAFAGSKPDCSFEETQLLPPIPAPRKILCIGLNYRAHRQETGAKDTAYPTVFTRFADSCVGHREPLVRPIDSGKFDYEGELAVIVGKRARRVQASQALDSVAGYACFNDGSIRDWQMHSSQYTPGKNFLSSGSFGPWMVTSDEVPDPANLTLSTRLNGREMQHSSTGDMIFDIPSLLAYITTWTQLEAGDVIATGTPSGVGGFRNPPIFMKPGDVVEVEISSIGVLRNPVVAGST